MIPKYKILTVAALASSVLSATAVAGLVPNGDFSTPNGDGWQENNGGGTYSFAYPDTGGNPDGYGLIDNSDGDGGFGIWVANGGEIITLDSLGLSAGETYLFSQDMMIMSGDTIGGFKVDFFSGPDFASSTGDIFPSTIGDGSTWETYNFPIPIPSGADGIKIVPLWGAGSIIGYDNICVDPSPIAQPPIPNGDFELGSAGWFELGDDTTFEYPNEGGNPNGHGVITNGTEGKFAIWVANGGAPLALADLGLEPGQLVTFQQDMRIISGDMIGGLKIEFLDGATFLGDTGDMRMDLIGDGSTWETYSFDVTIDSAADHIKVVPLWGSASSVGYDNITFIQPAEDLFAANIELGTVLNWIPEGPTLIHQPQGSEDEIEWDDIGEAVIGDSPTSAFVAGDFPFYRVDVRQFVLESATLNGGFESEGFDDPPCAEFWTCFSASSQPPTRIVTDSFTGDASIRIAVQNDAATPNNSELQQNISNVGGFITPGESYDFSFRAKQISSGVSYVQNYRVQWLDGGDVILPGGIEFTPFTGGDGEWKEIKVTGLVPPEAAVTAYIQIFGATGAVAGAEARGEVLIDDVSLATVSVQPYETIDADLADGLQVTWDTEIGKQYQVQSSPTDLEGFVDFGAPISGDGESAAISDVRDLEEKFYRVQRTNQ